MKKKPVFPMTFPLLLIDKLLFIELPSRIQYRTEVFGSALGEVGQSVRGLRDGYSQLAGGSEKIHSDLQQQKNIIHRTCV